MSTPHLRRTLTGLVLAVVAAVTTQLALVAPAHAGQVGVIIGIQGAGTVAVVEGSLEDGGAYACYRENGFDHRQTSYCPRVRNSEALEAWVWLRATPAKRVEGQWVFDGWSGCDAERIRDGNTECAVHSGAFSSDERTPIARFRDVVAPSVTALTADQIPNQNRRFRFQFAVDDGATECRLAGDATGFVPCTSPVEKVIPQGEHRFVVRAVDASGNADEAGADLVAVDTGLIAWVGNPDRSRTAEFTFDSNREADLLCSLDGGAWTACGSAGSGRMRYQNLADGSHTFRVKGRVGSWEDQEPAAWSWTVDTAAPTTQLAATTTGDGAYLVFSAPGAVSYQCRLTGPTGPGLWETCTSPVTHTDLGHGSHLFEVRAQDLAGNVEQSPASHSWQVDRVAPETTLRGQTGFVLGSSLTLGVGASEPGSTFACTLDGRARSCGTGGLALTGLARRTHVVTAAATDAAGNADPTRATHTWTVPLVAGDLARGAGWTSHRSSTAYGGRYLQATRKGATLRRSVGAVRSVALVVGKGRNHGTVRVYAGSRLLRTVRLTASSTRSRQVQPIATFTRPYTGSLRIVVATSGRTARIEGLGLATS